MDEGKITLSTSESISSQLCEEILSLMASALSIFL